MRIFLRIRNNGKHKRKSKLMLYAGILHVSVSMTNEFLERKVPSCSSSILPTGVLGIIPGVWHSNSPSEFLFSNYPEWIIHILVLWPFLGGYKLQNAFWLTFPLLFNISGVGLGDTHQALYTFLPHQRREKQETTNLARYFLKDRSGITKDKT